MKTEEVLLIGGAAAVAYFLLKEPKKKTIGYQVVDFINTVFAPGQERLTVGAAPDGWFSDRNIINASVSPTTAGVVGMVPTPRGDVSSALMLPDNGGVTYVDYSGGTPIGMPVVGSSFNNDTVASPPIAQSIGIPPTALQSPEAWQNGGAQYIGDNPPMLYNPPALVPVTIDESGNHVGGLIRVNPDYQLAPFEWFRTDEAGRKFVVSALSGEDVKYLEWASD